MSTVSTGGRKGMKGQVQPQQMGRELQEDLGKVGGRASIIYNEGGPWECLQFLSSEWGIPWGTAKVGFEKLMNGSGRCWSIGVDGGTRVTVG